MVLLPLKDMAVALGATTLTVPLIVKAPERPTAVLNVPPDSTLNDAELVDMTSALPPFFMVTEPERGAFTYSVTPLFTVIAASVASSTTIAVAADKSIVTVPLASSLETAPTYLTPFFV